MSFSAGAALAGRRAISTRTGGYRPGYDAVQTLEYLRATPLQTPTPGIPPERKRRQGDPERFLLDEGEGSSTGSRSETDN
jgi:hypothetical protein